MSAFDPAGACVVVTGAAGGIGAALATGLAARGGWVVVADLDAAGADRTVEAITAAGGTALAVAGDAASEEGVAALIATARQAYGPIAAWFGNAGIDGGHGLESSDADWARTVDVNVMAHVRAARHLIPEWIEAGGGRFVVTASAAGLLTMLGAPAYSVTKHGAVAFAEWLSATYRHRGVVVQALCPQWVQTGMIDEVPAALLGVGEVLSPESVADTVVEALGDDRFLILPHPEVAGYYGARASSTDRWLAGMNQLQQVIEKGEGS
ncbi:SDR family oxidoreductase [Gordonia sp. PP30]|uniref:SDR family NAD(P)-dependent oxidoreductase n=1 Tax=Gordonia sp. PP30 TaxID=2935861 RepID=UPI001FFFC77E|nr:SDR family oxidoreductase [Gordonia sp. PP30]UQE73299.1 SDR family oxidoreductase [Gordonia sp. PP30]